MAKAAKKAEEITEKQNAQKQVTFTKGLILAVDGFPESATVDEIKTFFKEFGNVGFVVHEVDTTTAQIRLVKY